MGGIQRFTLRRIRVREECAMATVKLSQALALAQADLQTGRLNEAQAICEAVIQVAPEEAEAHRLLGLTVLAQGYHDQAAVMLQQAAELGATWICYDNLSYVLKVIGRFEEAEAAARQAMSLAPYEDTVLCNLAAALQAQGRLEEASECYRQALNRTARATIHSSSLFCEQYRPDVTLARLARSHAEWDLRYGVPLAASLPRHENTPALARPLRLGFVSPDFGAHPVGYFLAGLLENLDQRDCHTVCYSDRLQASAAAWLDVRGLPDEALATQIRRDRIDILFDLAGHTGCNRMLVFARRPAPIQITWLGYVGTTGLSAMNYLLADRHEVPEGAERYYRERVLRMPEGYVCYQPPSDSPAVGPLPALGRGHVTFASFSSPAKINARVAALWSQVLQRVPGSRLMLKYCGFDAANTRRRVLDLFAAHQIASDRLSLEGWSPRAELLKCYNEVDLALDPFPYGGGLTTCEALWMGVPVLTCPGETFASRHALSHLSSVGFTETVARSPEHLVDLAADWAGDFGRLAAVRARLREQVAASPLCDAPRFAADFARLLRQAWRRWCERSQF
jgi:predicted O-linked N-acetylglucosamine transferase (SPINDLY family)